MPPWLSSYSGAFVKRRSWVQLPSEAFIVLIKLYILPFYLLRLVYHMFNKFHFILAIYFALAFIISIKHTYAYLKKGKMRHFRSYSVDSTYSFKTEPAKAYAVLASNCFFIGLLLILFVLTALFQFNILE